jgi:uncharacterized repeat protein (TIGR03809 family)
MINQIDVARGRDISARWGALAERRLEYLNELFETGRWRRFHSESEFLENIKEAKTAVETWRDLSAPKASCDKASCDKASRDKASIDIPWFRRTGAELPREELSRDPFHRRQLPQLGAAAEPPVSDLSISAETDHLCSDDALDALAWNPDLNPISDIASEPTPNISAMQERYPLLRNAL